LEFLNPPIELTQNRQLRFKKTAIYFEKASIGTVSTVYIMAIFRKIINAPTNVQICRSMYTLKRLKRPISVAPMVDITTPVK
jgi:hypothetical protein